MRKTRKFPTFVTEVAVINLPLIGRSLRASFMLYKQSLTFNFLLSSWKECALVFADPIVSFVVMT